MFVQVGTGVRVVVGVGVAVVEGVAVAVGVLVGAPVGVEVVVGIGVQLLVAVALGRLAWNSRCGGCRRRGGVRDRDHCPHHRQARDITFPLALVPRRFSRIDAGLVGPVPRA